MRSVADRDSTSTQKTTNTGGISSELLINVIRTLVSTASDEQRQLERERIEQGYQQSEKNIDTLLREHRADVLHCLSTFQSVSRALTNSREQIRNVKNSLSLCKTYLQCRRDDLNKFWLENAQQKTICDILRQIQQIKEIDKTIDTQLANREYKELIGIIKDADILLKGPLKTIEGISQLRFIVSDNLQKVFTHIVNELLQCIFIEPFEIQMLKLVKSGKARESNVYSTLIERYPKKKINLMDEQYVRKRLADLLETLSVFNQIDSALDDMFNQMQNLLLTQANETAKIIQMNTSDIGALADSTNLAQFVHILIGQLSAVSRQHAFLSAELQEIQHTPANGKPILHRFWDIAQQGMEEILAEHLLVWRNKKQRGTDEQDANRNKVLFSFENASFVSSVNASSRKKQIQLVCQPDIYNVVAIFHKLSLFCREIENQLGEDCCPLGTFLHTYVAEAFFEQNRNDLERKTEQALGGADLWIAMIEVPTHIVKVLTSCVRIFDLCEQINTYILNMELYSLRFASFWLLILEHFTKGISDKYMQITLHRQTQADALVEYPKLSATWVVDEDISRLLKSLPSWTAVKSSMFLSATDQIQTPFAGAATGIGAMNTIVEGEQEIRERTQRESEILIGNLGIQKQLKRTELITNMEHVKILACLHETLQWFVGRMRERMDSLSPRSRELIKARIQITTGDGTNVEQMLCDAITDRIESLEKLSDNMLLILHLELRFHCFFHLLPIAQNQNSQSVNSLSQEEMDSDVMEFGRDLSQLHVVLQAHLSVDKLKYLFDGLGYLCSAIFIHSCQHITKLTDMGRKRICRAIFTVQKYLSQLSGRPETEMQRAQMFFDLLNKELDQLFATIIERGAVFTYVEYSILLALLIRSHPQLNSQPGALESATNQLRSILTQRANQQQKTTKILKL